jgi:hypothetical protein
MGTIVHQKVIEAKSGAGQGELTVETDWHKADGSTLLHERTQFVFRADGTSRTIDRITTLTALGERVVFNDNKEGVLGLRVARGLEQPATQPDVFTDASERPPPPRCWTTQGHGADQQEDSRETPSGAHVAAGH